MTYSKQQLWQRFQEFYTEFPQIGMALDISRMNFGDDFLPSMKTRIGKALDEMAQLERGAIANPDENRMVGHYWLRNPSLAPTEAIRSEIEETIARIKVFAEKVHSGEIRGPDGPFRNVLHIGIGGSALGPQFVAQALGRPSRDKMKVRFFDNTDPDGIDNILSLIGEQLSRTICVIVSKSGGTKETRNGMFEAEVAFKAAGLDFGRHAIAITSQGSELGKYATKNNWLTQFPMWDWVGGRTSELSAVGLLPAALQGLDIDGLLAGARACDEITRVQEVRSNPSAQLALMWYYAGNGKGEKNMVVLPYKDRLELFAKYLQQLVMESLGKERGRDGAVVNQGITVFGNKGATDQHSYVQQLRDGLRNFFVVFIEVLRDRHTESRQVEPGITSGDYLHAFLHGTKQALYENGRESMSIIVNDINEFTIGTLIAVFERAVGFYASLININAYHQPGVEAGKRAAGVILGLQAKVLKHLAEKRPVPATAESIAAAIGASDDPEMVFHICQHLAGNPERKIEMMRADSSGKATFRMVS